MEVSFYQHELPERVCAFFDVPRIAARFLPRAVQKKRVVGAEVVQFR